jgi:hypothetical protein
MPITERTSHRLVLKSGSTTLTLDKTADKAILQRKLLLWGLKPVEAPLSEISDITIDAAVDRASGVEVCHTMLIMKGRTVRVGPFQHSTKRRRRRIRPHCEISLQ